MIAFITEHKDHSVTGLDGGAGLRWGVEPLCQVLTEHGINKKNRPFTLREMNVSEPRVFILLDGEY